MQDALEGLRDVLYNRQYVRVPHAEMTDAITVKDTAPHHLRPGSWVRIKSVGVYKGDLAQVDEVDQEGAVIVKVIPRIDYQAIAERCGPAGVTLLEALLEACCQAGVLRSCCGARCPPGSAAPEAGDSHVSAGPAAPARVTQRCCCGVRP